MCRRGHRSPVVEANYAFQQACVYSLVIHGLALEQEQHTCGKGIQRVISRAAKHTLHLAHVLNLEISAISGERREAHRLGGFD